MAVDSKLEAKFGHRPGVRLKGPRFKRGGEIYTLRPQSITIAAGMRGNGGIRTHYEKLCYELINYAVRIEVGLSTDVLLLSGRNHMTGDLDFRGNKIILPGGIKMNRKLITDLDTDENDDLSAVNMVTLKKYHPNAPEPTHDVVKDIDLKELFIVTNYKPTNV